MTTVFTFAELGFALVASHFPALQPESGSYTQAVTAGKKRHRCSMIHNLARALGDWRPTLLFSCSHAANSTATVSGSPVAISFPCALKFTIILTLLIPISSLKHQPKQHFSTTVQFKPKTWACELTVWLSPTSIFWKYRFNANTMIRRCGHLNRISEVDATVSSHSNSET